MSVRADGAYRLSAHRARGLPAQRHRPRVEWRAGRAAQAQGRAEEGELVDPVARQLLQKCDLHHRHALLGEQIEVDRQIVPGDVGCRLVLDGGLIGADEHRAVALDQPLLGRVLRAPYGQPPSCIGRSGVDEPTGPNPERSRQSLRRRDCNFQPLVAGKCTDNVVVLGGCRA